MNFNLRPATQSDAHSIRRLVRTARINPTGLDWRRFILATLPSGEIIGCGQVKLHADGTRELASIAVAEEYRGEGIARALIENLTNVHPQPIYLTCRANLEDLYEKFGFEVIRPAEMPPYFYRVHTLARILKRVRIMHEDLLVMRSADQKKSFSL